jgi:hypothetical protein
VSSSKSGSSSVLTNISVVSNDSLAVLVDSSEKEATSTEAAQEPKGNEMPVSADEERKPDADSSIKEDIMKVPALKIIFSNSNGSLPYVKTTPKDQKVTGKSAAKKEITQEATAG